MKYNFLYLLLFIFLNTVTFSQNNFGIEQFKNESIQFVKQPINWEGSDWLKLGLIGAGTFIVMQVDQPVREMFQRNPDYIKSAPIEFGRYWGELYSPFIIAGSLGTYGLIKNNSSIQKLGFEIFQSTVYTEAIVALLKYSLGRARPYMNQGKNSFGNLYLLNEDYQSLPSSHTAIAFSLSTILSKNAQTDFMKIAAYLPAALTAISRVYQDQHWASDVFLGGIIGYVVGDWVTSQHKTKISFQAFSPRQLTVVIPLN
jgi:hypothetical protein